MALSLTRENPLSNKLPNHISEAFLAARSKYENIVGRGGGGEIPKGGGRAGRARPLGIWPRGREIPRDLARGGGEITGEQNPWDTGITTLGISLNRGSTVFALVIASLLVLNSCKAAFTAK